MKFIAGMGVSSLSGSQGGTTASRNANGAYFRNKAIPTNTNTVPQQLARARFGTVSQIWGSLSDIEKQSFQDQVTAYPYIDNLGQSKTYTPSQLCNVVNQRILQTNGVPVIAGDGLPAPVVRMMPAPVSFPFAEDLTVAIDVSASTALASIGLSDALAELPDGTIAIIDATSQLSSGVTRPKSPMFRNIATVGSNEPVTALNLWYSYYLVFGLQPAVGMNLWFRVTTLNTDTGVYSTSVMTLASITA